MLNEQGVRQCYWQNAIPTTIKLHKTADWLHRQGG